MKRLVLALLLIVLFALPAQARMSLLIGTGQEQGTASCDVANNEVGDRQTLSSHSGGSVGLNVMYCLAATADCSGTLGYGYATHDNTSSETLQVCIYNRTGAASSEPVEGDTKVACQSLTTSTDSAGAPDQKTGSELGGSVTASGNYWYCMMGTTSYSVAYSSTAAYYRYASSGCADCGTTPPANLGEATWGGTWGTGAERTFPGYVEIK